MTSPDTQKIRVLDDAVANQIAAGEVVENPASVVKELVENSLDAEASKVAVYVEGGGIELLRVVDDGVGMSSPDAQAALMRHATSKIRSADDLVHIATLGFRGEALPSIASVSRLMLKTKERGSLSGARVRHVPGKPQEVGPIGCPEGTSIEVAELFFNTPARRKFLKSERAESAKITEVFVRLALSRPGVAFSLTRGGRVTKSFLARPNLSERVTEVLGSAVSLHHGSGDVGPFHIEAWVSGPERSRVGARSLHLMVNGRLVRDPGLLRAVWAGFDGILDQGHYPQGVVTITISPKYVDVNVHPQKSEVRFVDRGAVHSAVVRVVGEAVGSSKGFSFVPQSMPHWQPSQSAPKAYAPAQSLPLPLSEASADWAQPTPHSLFPHDPAPAAVPTTPKTFSSLRYVGQAKKTWLLCEDLDGLVIIDQHAAHERVTFEKLKAAYKKKGVPAQHLLVPEQVEVSAEEMSKLEEQADDLRRLGFEVEPFGAATVAIAAVPALLAKADPRRLLDEILGEILREPLAASFDAVIARLACHGSIRGGDVLKLEEVEALLQSLDQATLGGHCPHGRPVYVALPWAELDRRMGRR